MSTAFLILVGWTAVAFVVGTVLGWSIRDADHRELAVEPDDLTALIQPESWSQAAVDAEFAAMVPDVATERTWWA